MNMRIASIYLLLFGLFGSDGSLYSQITFQKVFGGEDLGEYLTDVIETTTGEFVAVGFSNSYNGSNGTNFDSFMIKMDQTGGIIWSKTYGGPSLDQAYTLLEASDGNYLFFGNTESYGIGNADFYLVKTDPDGNMIWNKTFGGTSHELGKGLIELSGGGFIMIGWTLSYGTGQALYVVRTDINGDLLWGKAYGGALFDRGWGVVETQDGGIAIAGKTKSYGQGQEDVYLLKLDLDGNVLWNRTIGGVSRDFGYALIETSDGNLVVTGASESFSGGPFWDLYLLKVSADGTLKWAKSYGEANTHDLGWSLLESEDGNYVVAGFTQSYGAGFKDALLMKVDTAGDFIWGRTVGDAQDDYHYEVIQTGDGGFLCVGATHSWDANINNSGGDEFYIVKSDSAGNSGCYEASFIPMVKSGAFVDSGVVVTSGGQQGSGYSEWTVNPDTMTLCSQIAICTPLGMIMTQQDEICNNQCNGSITTLVTTGVGPFTYLWSPVVGNSTDSIITGLCSGSYSVTITASDGCDTTISFTITEPNALTMTTVDTAATCGLSDGSATVTASDGTPGYTYLWNDSLFQTTSSATGLSSGIYQVTVTDTNGCQDSLTITITEPPLLTGTLNLVDASCGNSDGQATATPIGGTMPYTYAWDNDPPQGVNTVDTLSVGPHTVTITDDNGCDTTYIFTIINPNAPTLALTQTAQIQCFGDSNATAQAIPTGGASPFTYSWTDPQNQNTQTPTNLPPGQYTVTVTDDNNCQVQQTIMITEPPQLTSQITLINATCDNNNGTATASASGGTGAITYQWDDPLNQTTAQITSLTPNTYTVTIADANGCITTETTTIIMLTSNPLVTAWPDTTITQGQSVQINSSGGDTCLWVPLTGLSSPNSCDPTATPAQTTIYIVEVTVNGCKNFDTITIIVETFDVHLFFPNIFSPNQDGINDYLGIEGKGITSLHLVIYNRWGQTVFETDDQNIVWDGKLKNENLNLAGFVYHIQAELADGTLVNQSGTITLVR